MNLTYEGIKISSSRIAEACGVSRNAVVKWKQDGLAAEKHGRFNLTPINELVDYLKSTSRMDALSNLNHYITKIIQK